MKARHALNLMKQTHGSSPRFWLTEFDIVIAEDRKWVERKLKFHFGSLEVRGYDMGGYRPQYILSCSAKYHSPSHSEKT